MGIGSKLKELLEERNMSVAELSRLSGVPSTTIYTLIKNDASKVNVQALICICKALHVKTDVFFEAYMEEYEECQRNEETVKKLGMLKAKLMCMPEEVIDELLRYADYLVWVEKQKNKAAK